MKKCGYCVYFTPRHWGTGYCSYWQKMVVSTSETTARKCGHFAFDRNKYMEMREEKDGRSGLETV